MANKREDRAPKLPEWRSLGDGLGRVRNRRIFDPEYILAQMSRLPDPVPEKPVFSDFVIIGPSKDEGWNCQIRPGVSLESALSSATEIARVGTIMIDDWIKEGSFNLGDMKSHISENPPHKTIYLEDADFFEEDEFPDFDLWFGKSHLALTAVLESIPIRDALIRARIESVKIAAEPALVSRFGIVCSSWLHWICLVFRDFGLGVHGVTNGLFRTTSAEKFVTVRKWFFGRDGEESFLADDLVPRLLLESEMAKQILRVSHKTGDSTPKGGNIPRDDSPDEDEIACARQVCRANPRILRDDLAKQLQIGKTKATLLLDLMREEQIVKTKKRKTSGE